MTMAGVPFKIPELTQDDFHAFHEAHFSKPASDHFLSNFLQPDHIADQKHAPYPAEEEFLWDKEDDGLGYYEDGVKRTLTDVEIEFLRQSELESLRRAQEKSSTRKLHTTNQVAPAADSKTDDQTVDEGQLSEEGELSSAPQAAPSKKKKKKNNKSNRNRKGASYRDSAGELIDLRKRTWDVVDKGLTTLAYDEETNTPAQTIISQRQRISYDD